MKDLSTLVNKLDLTNPGNHQLQDQVPEIVKTIVDSLFDQLAFVFPAWKYTWDTEEKIRGAKKEWVKAFFENEINTKQQISNGLKKARASNTDFLPSCGKFISWCKPSPEDLGYPSNEKALRLCIEYRNQVKLFPNFFARPLIVELCKRVDWWLMNAVTNQQSQAKATAHFNSIYMDLLNSGFKEPEATMHERLPTQQTVDAGLSEQQQADKKKRALDNINEIKKKLRRTK